MAGIGQQPLVKCALQNLDENFTFNAHYNPKELAWSKKVPWKRHRRSKGDAPHLEFTSAESASLTCELFFDTYETKANVYKESIVHLEQLVMVKENGKGKAKRPPRVLFVWGNDFPGFLGVVESLDVKYTMFLPSGRPVRATATITLTQAEKASAKVRRKKKKPKNKATGTSGAKRTPRDRTPVWRDGDSSLGR